jgi:hypothetical protein
MSSKERAARGVPGEGPNPRRTNLEDTDENGGVGSNRNADFTVSDEAWKGAFARHLARGGVL